LVVSAVLASVVLLASAGAVVVVASRDDDPASDRASSVSSDPDDSPGSPPTAAEQELNAVVEDISAFVAQERGLEFREPVAVELEDDAAFEERLFEDASHGQDDFIADAQVLFEALGLLEPGGDLGGQFDEAMGTGVVGFYDPTTGELVVRGTELTTAVRITIAHELTHALDDQHFDLDRSEYDDSEDEVSFGFTALVEGQAVRMEEAYFRSLPQAEQDAYIAEVTAEANAMSPDIPEALLQMIGAPYIEGPAFVEALFEAGGQAAVDAAYDNPPRTSEQVLDPEAFMAGDEPVEVEHPTADGDPLGDMMFGRMFLELVLKTEIPNRDADTAATGWGGDWMTWWEDGAQSCMRATFVGDTPTDSNELRDAWSSWDEGTSLTVTVDQPRSGQPVTVTSCTA
jgi:hypothetical protein